MFSRGLIICFKYGIGPIVNMSLVNQARTEQAADQTTTALAHSWAVSGTVFGSVHSWAAGCGLGSLRAPFNSKGKSVLSWAVPNTVSAVCALGQWTVVWAPFRCRSTQKVNSSGSMQGVLPIHFQH